MRKAILLAILFAIFRSTLALAGPMGDLDASMRPIAEQLIVIDKALAADSTEGVQVAATAIVELNAKVKTEGLPGEDGKKLDGLEDKLLPAAKAMAAAETLEAQRAALGDLTKPIALWATIRQPDGMYVAYCPMAPGSWLQAEEMISNPYYGASMLRCGQIVERSDKVTDSSARSGQPGH